MHLIDLRLSSNLEVEERLRRNRAPSRKELDYPDFPYIFYYVDFKSFIGNRVPWHWHRDLEIVEVMNGTIHVRTGRSELTVKEGEFCYINANLMHCIQPENAEECCIRSQLFLPDLISGSWGNALDNRYVSPVLDCRGLDLFLFSGQSEQGSQIQSHLARARDICQAREFGYEFDVRHELTEAWKLLFLCFKPRLAQRKIIDDRSEERMHAMLNFIQQNYMNKLELADIANAAAISERECFRCFQKTLGFTPIHYLQNYRIRMAARMLISTDDTVLNICQSVGFSDSSYFGKVFQKYLHCSPTEYRRRHLQTAPL